MPAEDKSSTGRQPLNGQTDNIVSKTVPSGEIWYVESAYVIGEGGGDETNLNARVAVMDSDTIDSMYSSVDDSHRGIALSIDTSVFSADSSSIGVYAVGGQEIRFYEISEAGSTGQYEYGVIMRRIL